MQEIYYPTIAESEITEGTIFATVVEGWHILITRIEGEIYVVNDRCPHAASPLSTGRVRRGTVMCPLHGARFDLATGNCVGGAYPPLRRFAVRVQEGIVAVALPAGQPGMNDLPIIFS